MGRIEIDEEKANRMRQAHPEWFSGRKGTRPYLNWTREMDDYINELYAESNPKSNFVSMFNIKFNTNKSYSSIAQRYHVLSKNFIPTYAKVRVAETEAVEVVQQSKVTQELTTEVTFTLDGDIAEKLKDLKENKFVNVDAFVSSVIRTAVNEIFG